jgi:hypothetical protein
MEAQALEEDETRLYSANIERSAAAFSDPFVA